MTKVRVGLVGCGFVAELHMDAYQRVYGLDAQVTAVAARGDHVLDFAKKHRIRRTYRDFKSLLADKEIDVVDICTPPALHAAMIVEAMQAGKHVICEKPFTGYFGRGDDKTPIGKHVPKSLMYERVMEEMDKTCAAIKSSGRLFMYADPVDVEDWGMLTLTFSDGTKSTVFSGDMIMGGVRNVIETYTSGGTLFANITPNNHMTSYLTDEEKLAGVYITEKVDRKTGWQFICLEEEWTRGYLQEIQDFMECAAVGRQPRAGLNLAYETTKINYAGYWSAEDGRRIAL